MPFGKRKRGNDDASSTSHSTRPAEDASSRRATRQTVAENAKQLRSGKVRANSASELVALQKSSPPALKKKKDAPNTTTVPGPALRQSALPRRPASRANTRAATTPEPAIKDAEKEKENVRPHTQRARETAIPPPILPPQLRSPTSTTQRQQTRIPPPTFPQPTRLPPQAPASTLFDPAAASAVTPARRASIVNNKKPPPTPGNDRNIDQVVLGDIFFRAWYPSYYTKEVLADAPSNGAGNKVTSIGGTAKIGGGKKDKEAMIERLYICPCCFKYSNQVIPFRQHVKQCEKTWSMPGTKVYTHPRAKPGIKSPVVGSRVDSDYSKLKGKKKSDVQASTATVSDMVGGEWSVWELDGEKDGLFCQNLSLFAKLFLDNKSVFYDVTGFNYFLLVYTPPSSNFPSNPEITASPLGARVVGFFSKEKMSWDNNNLACILVFPPWQRKSLGPLLMGVSYEISKREGILGGPEKPISELGRKGYKRFWAGEIARWILSVDISASGEKGAEEHLVDVDDCSKATWICPEDCLAVLREMGVVEEAGIGPPKGADVKPAEEGEEPKGIHQVPRVRIDKEAVRRWVEANKIGLERPCDPDGFVEGYAVKDQADLDEHEEEEADGE